MTVFSFTADPNLGIHHKQPLQGFKYHMIYVCPSM